MRPVVLDTSVVLPAVLSSRGYRRRFLVILVLGALAARRDLLRQEADGLHADAASTGAGCCYPAGAGRAYPRGLRP